MASDNVVIITSDNFDDLINGDKPVLVDFWATWCPPCKALSPVVDELAEHYKDKVVIAKCDVDDNGDLAARFGVQAVPTLLLFKDGKKIEEFVGAMDKQSFVDGIDSALQ